MVVYFVNFVSNKYSIKFRVKLYFSNLIDLNNMIKVIKIFIFIIWYYYFILFYGILDVYFFIIENVYFNY